MITDCPSRSLLISPKPLGMGSSNAEAIVSFLLRVAPENNLTFGEVMWGKALRHLESENRDLGIVRGIGSASLAHGSVSVSKTGLLFAEALARLTGRGDARAMNWHAATEGISHARLLRKTQAWCPQCLASDPIPYFRMLWDLNLASACDEHGCQLALACSVCKQSQQRYRCSGSPAHCQHCEAPLASAQVIPALPREIEISHQLGRIVADITGQRLTITGDAAKRSLFTWADRAGATSVKTKARLLGMPQSLVCYWQYTDREPSLQRLLELCFRNGLPAPEVCRGSVTVEQCASTDLGAARAWRFRTLSEEEKEGIQERVAEIAERDFPPCIKHAATELGVAAGTLKALAPAACDTLTKRSKAQKNLTNKVRFIRFQQKVRWAIKRAVDQGEVPTMRTIGAALSAPGILRAPKCHAFARAEIARAKAGVRDAKVA